MANAKEEGTSTTTRIVTATQAISVPVSPPQKFDFSMPQAWPQWRKRFERFMTVSAQNAKTDNDKVNILMYILGEEAEDVMLQFVPTPTTYSDTIQAFENHFIPRRNLIFERYKFNSRIQQPGEPIEVFITSLHSLAEHCQYGGLKDELIRDRIVVGMLDRKTSERLQLQANLTLSDCIMAVKQAELQEKQSRELRGAAAVAAIDIRADERDGGSGDARSRVHAVYGSNPRGAVAKPSRFYEKKGREEVNKKTARKCGFCGLAEHQREKCPAKQSMCRSCNKQGHWATVCRSNKKVRSIQLDIGSNDNNIQASCNNCSHNLGITGQFLGSIEIKTSSQKEWLIPLKISELNREFKFMIDTGADITCIPASLLSNNIIQSLHCNNRVVTGPSGKILNILGILHGTLRSAKNECFTDIYVIKELCKPILGRSAITALNILQFGDGVCSKVNFLKLDQIEQKFPKIFDQIGAFKTEFEIKVDKDIQPFIQSVPRVVPIPLLKPLKDELTRLQSLNIIEPVEHHTPWVSPIVIVRKNNDKIRLCVDYTRLNKAVMRTHFPIGKVERILAQVQGSKYFSRIDTTSGFYQIKLSESCQDLTCFITPYGRYKFKRLPFGITCAPEYFSMLIHKILKGLDNVIFHIDDILVHAPSIEEHNKILNEVLLRIHQEGITLNKEKCVFGVLSLEFLGHSIAGEGISIDPKRISAIVKFPEPSDKNELLRFLGMVNFSCRYIPNRSDVLEPLTSLLKKNVSYSWDLPQKRAFKKIKSLLQESPCLEYFDPSQKIIISADASSYGIGSCLLQEDKNGNKKVVCYASRLLSKTEQHYAQIEREALALTWSCDKYSEYIYGLKVFIETDHKPLVQVLQTKNIDELTPRLQRFRLRLLRYEYEIYYVPGKDLVVADALSRNIDENSEFPKNDELALDTDAFVNLITTNFEIKPYFLEEIKSEQNKDPICLELKEYVRAGWPNKNKIKSETLVYFQYRQELSECDGYLLRGSRLIIPQSLQSKTLGFIHQGHQGIVKSRARAKSSVWWPGLSTNIENLVRNCPRCIEFRVNVKEPFHKDVFPDRAWQKIALDLFKENGTWYLIVTDYFSRFFEIFKLQLMTEQVIITKLKELFARYGLPEIVRSDNGPQFQSEFKKFAKDFDFVHITSSPKYPQSNGCIEAAVKTAKSLLKKGDDIYLSLLAYRSTPLENGFSPAELLFNKKIRSLLPIVPKVLNQTVDTSPVFQRERRYKSKMQRNYDKRHRTKELPELHINESVWVTDLKKYGKVLQKLREPNSYLIEINGANFRRNRWFLIPAKYYVPVFNEIVPQTNYNYNTVTHTPSSSTIDSPTNTNIRLERYSEKNVESQSAVSLDNKSFSESVSEPEIQEEQVDNHFQSVSSRPVRSIRKPLYLNDYVT